MDERSHEVFTSPIGQDDPVWAPDPRWPSGVVRYTPGVVDFQPIAPPHDLDLDEGFTQVYDSRAPKSSSDDLDGCCGGW